MTRSTSRRRTSRRLRPNSVTPRGFPWNQRTEVYHTTVALEAVRDQGLKPRRELGDVHATGGGPDESISFTTDYRVTLAIAIGLRVFAHVARGEMQLGQLIIDMDQLAPKGTAKQLDSMRLTPEDVVRLDAGLIPFSAGVGSWQHRVAMEVLQENRGDLVDLSELFAGGTKPFAANGWAVPEVVERMQQQSAPLMHSSYTIDKNTNLYAANKAFELYKYALSYAEYENEAYNPLFMHTEPTFMRTVPDAQIGVVSALLDAKWLCAEPNYAEKLGYDISGMGRPTISDWAHGCEGRMRYGWEVRTKPVRDWDQPEASDTVSYAGAMAEVRVYDSRVIQKMRVAYDLDDTLAETSTEWWKKKGVEVERPVMYPHFEVRHTQMV